MKRKSKLNYVVAIGAFFVLALTLFASTFGVGYAEADKNIVIDGVVIDEKYLTQSDVLGNIKAITVERDGQIFLPVRVVADMTGSELVYHSSRSNLFPIVDLVTSTDTFNVFGDVSGAQFIADGVLYATVADVCSWLGYTYSLTENSVILESL